MANQTLSNLVRTLSTYFRIGTIRIKDNSGVVAMRESDDSAHAELSAKKAHIMGTNATYGVILDAPSSLGGNVSLVLPNSQGSTGQVLTTNGSGTLSWAGVAADADKTEVISFTESTSSPATIFSPADNTVIRQIVVEVTAAASGGSPTIQIGYTSDADAYMEADECDLGEAGLYTLFPMTSVGVSPDDVILTITPDSQTFTGKVYVTYAVP